MDKTSLIDVLAIVASLIGLLGLLAGLTRSYGLTKSYHFTFKKKRKKKKKKKLTRKRATTLARETDGWLHPGFYFDYIPAIRAASLLKLLLARWNRQSGKPEPEPVLLGASAPHAVRPGEEFTARFVAYIAGLEEEVRLQLHKLSPRSKLHLGVKHCRWHPGTKVTVRLYGEHILVSSPQEEFTWDGSKNLIEFDASVRDGSPNTTTVLKFDALIGGIIIAKLRMDLLIDSKSNVGIWRSEWTKPARSAFASYASADRLRVLDRVSEIQRNGVDVFLDCLSLHPGEEWKPILEDEIIQRELFLLFWSTFAKQSEWVTWEWRTALKHKGLSGIDPHTLDPVFDAEPPEELKGLHFGDPHMLARKAYQQHEITRSK